ncbi:MAG: transporter substrate-binding domain-containing protein [Gammaproteobacteria bacterium]|nr:transporter substrate-binding domain-containing protein [Gammaproteobacteria bacterium]
MKFRLFFTALLLSLVCFQSVFAQNRIIKIATLDWQPYVDKNSDNKGFTAEIVTRAFQQSGYQVEIDFMPWSRVLKEVEIGNYDAMFPSYESPQRRKKYLFSKPFAHSPLVLFQRQGLNLTFNKLEDLKPYKIGVVRGYVNTKAFDAASFLNKKETKNDLQNIKKLVKNRIDLAVIDKYAALDLIKQHKIKKADKLSFIEAPLENKPLYLCVSKKIKDSSVILEAFQKGLDQLKESGEVEKIINKQLNKTHP